MRRKQKQMLIIAAVLAGGYFFKDKLIEMFHKITGSSSTPTPGA